MPWCGLLIHARYRFRIDALHAVALDTTFLFRRSWVDSHVPCNDRADVLTQPASTWGDAQSIGPIDVLVY